MHAFCTVLTRDCRHPPRLHDSLGPVRRRSPLKRELVITSGGDHSARRNRAVHRLAFVSSEKGRLHLCIACMPAVATSLLPLPVETLVAAPSYRRPSKRPLRLVALGRSDHWNHQLIARLIGSKDRCPLAPIPTTARPAKGAPAQPAGATTEQVRPAHLPCFTTSSSEARVTHGSAASPGLLPGAPARSMRNVF